MKIDLDRFRDIFFQECEEHLATLESSLLALLETPDDLDLLNAVFRAAHSIKGSSATFGYERVSRFTHAMENLLDRMRGGLVPTTPQRVNLILEAVDMLRALLDAARTGETAEADPTTLTDLLTVAQRAGEFSRGTPPIVRSDDPNKPPAVIRFRPNPDILRQGMDPALVLRDLAHFGEVRQVTTDVSALPGLDRMDPESCWLAWEIHIVTDRRESELRDAFAFVEDGAELSIDIPRRQVRKQPNRPLQTTASNAASREGTIRVATGKVDKIIDLVGELVIAQSMAAQVLSDFSMSRLYELQTAFSDIERFTRELQQRVMGVRMLPVGTVFSRFPRLVHDLAASTGKRIAIDISGEDTELDKGVVESMSDPLMHLIRNAADHGLEMPDERITAGKEEEGRIQLRAYHEGGSVVVEVSDDGRGLDAERIRAKALERGLIRPKDDLTESQIHALVFEPGFSTAQTITDISGRGVGMDVVKKNVEALNGSVSISSEAGRGTSVRIKLPLTLAILDGLLLRVGPEVYVVPLTAIMESLRPLSSQVAVVAGQGEVVLVRGEPIPLVRLHRVFGVLTRITDPTQGLVVLVEHQGKLSALLVDELLGQQQVVIKTLETNFRKVEGVAGATILGDGRAALILDVAGLLALAQTRRLGIERAA